MHDRLFAALVIMASIVSTIITAVAVLSID